MACWCFVRGLFAIFSSQLALVVQVAEPHPNHDGEGDLVLQFCQSIISRLALIVCYENLFRGDLVSMGSYVVLMEYEVAFFFEWHHLAR